MLFWLLMLTGLLASGFAASASGVSADSARLRRHLAYLVGTPQPRNHEQVPVLDSVAAYLGRQLIAAGARVSEQPYQAGGNTYRNVVGSFGPADAPRIIVGAHYDVCGTQPGADDNGSGVASLLELARLIGQEKQLRHRIDLVAYTLEEPPYFRTKQMGSYVHAKSLHDAKVPVLGMVSLEMLGYFDERKGSQHYPFGPLKLVYGSRGNYVTTVRKFGNGSFSRPFARTYKRVAQLPVRRFQAPAALPGIDFSDHLNYWQFGYSALMLTDTAFFRNRNYHHATDSIEKLDFGRMALAVDAVLATLLRM
ncbi:M28 family peptidase [Hymenobacter oligotrophus]|uniref:M28 family peptidase n=1 Tax=Hymenobacter oligotrophus TaxID=2319843 RepID=A0A3B7QYQ3_9BACT|nr:M28 family peptidase [Hymenobacter oligotrophus]AYA36522.1 M28 family peptidase [Hymenobacter oligotrophus]